MYTPTWALETIPLPNTFNHLTRTLRSLSFLDGHCSSQTLMSLVTQFPHLESLQLDNLYVNDAKFPCPPLERQTFKGSLNVLGWNSGTGRFYRRLAEHNLRYHKMCVSGVDWLLDNAPCNTCLVKCSEHLESFGIYWIERECSFRQSEGNYLTTLVLRTSGRCQIQYPDFQEPTKVVDTFLELHAAAPRILPISCHFNTTSRNHHTFRHARFLHLLR